MHKKRPIVGLLVARCGRHQFYSIIPWPAPVGRLHIGGGLEKHMSRSNLR
jgi:hypothetical protein